MEPHARQSALALGASIGGLGGRTTPKPPLGCFPPDAQIKQAVYKFLASHKEGVRGIRALTKGADITNVKAVTNWIKKNPKLLKTTGVKPHVRYFVP